MFGWNESGQLAQATNLARPAECFSAVEKLLMACCTMQVRVMFGSKFSISAGVKQLGPKVISISAGKKYECVRFQLKKK